MEEFLAPGWLKCGEVPVRDLWRAGPGAQLGHVNELLVKDGWDGTAINVWIIDQELRIWIKKQKEKLRIKTQMDMLFDITDLVVN